MTNTGTGKQGIATMPRKHDRAGLRDWLRQYLANDSYTVRMFVLNRMEQVAKHWFLQGGGDAEEFEKLFNNERHESSQHIY